MLGGRAYGSAATQTTIAQSGYLMGVLRKHGLDRVINKDGDLLGAVMEAGCASALVAGLLTEDRKSWTRDEALKNAAFFDALPNDDNKVFWDALALLLADFFVPGGSSSTASPTSSTRPPRKTAARGRKPRLPANKPPNSAEMSGPESSPPLLSEPASA